jgi:ketosteroid isomerase-like protein
MALFAPDIVSFDLGPPLACRGAQAFRAHWDATFAALDHLTAYEVHDLTIVACEELAFSRSLNRMAGVTTGGLMVERRLRWTAGWRCVSNRWLIVHEHVSVPTDVRTETALLNLNS